MSPTVEDAIKLIIIAANGEVVVLGTAAGIPIGAMFVSDVAAQCEELTAEIVASLDFGSQQLKAFWRGDDIGSFFRGAVVVCVGMPMGGEVWRPLGIQADGIVVDGGQIAHVLAV